MTNLALIPPSDSSSQDARDAIHNALGFSPDSIDWDKGDKGFTRFATKEKRGDNSGWYVAYSQPVRVVVFGDWRTGQKEVWKSSEYKRLSKADQEAVREKIERARELEKQNREARQREAQQKAQTIYNQASEVSDHPYLSKKGVTIRGAKVNVSGDYAGWLVVPFYQLDGEIWSIQFISENEKRFLSGGKIQSGFFPIHGKDGKIAPLLICEGAATAASISLALPRCDVWAVGSAGNVAPVVRAVRASEPTRDIIICADRDKNGVGERAAREAIQDDRISYVLPTFREGSSGTDFNDLHQEEGIEAVRKLISLEVERVDWKQPEEIRISLKSVPSLSDSDWSQSMPGVIYDWAKDVSDRMSSPIEFVAFPMLAALGSVAGNAIRIKPKQADSWTEAANLYVAIVGRPGALKSPCLKDALRPIRLLEDRARMEYQKAEAEYQEEIFIQSEVEKKAEEDRKKESKKMSGEQFRDYLRSQRQAKREATPLEPPKMRRYVAGDSTPEALIKVLQESAPNGLLVERDELPGLWQSLMGEENQGRRSLYLSGWNAGGRERVDRIARGTNQFAEVTLSVTGTVQPSKLSRFLDSGKAENDGLIQRFLLIYPDQSADYKEVDKEPNREALKRAEEIFEEVDKLVRENGPMEVSLSDEARPAYIEWREDLERQIRDQATPRSDIMIEAISKMRKHVPAFALLHWLADENRGPCVNTDHWTRGLDLAEFCLLHLERCYALAAAPAREGARALAKKMGSGDLTGTFTQRSIQRKGWESVPSDPDTLRESLEILVDYGYLKESSHKSEERGRPSSVFEVNPKVIKRHRGHHG